VGSTATLVAKAGTLADATRVHLGGWAGLVFGDHLILGGGGFALTDDVELPGSDGGSGFGLGMGYGGVMLKVRHPVPWNLTGELGVLVGAGNARVRDILGGGELGSSNFFLLEPEIAVFRRLHSLFHVGVSIGYRKAWGIEDLPRVSEGDMNSFTGAISLQLGGS
jgi:hypothetical protein